MSEVTIQSEFFVTTFAIALENHLNVALVVQIIIVYFDIDETIAGRTVCMLLSRNFLTRNAEYWPHSLLLSLQGSRGTHADVAN